MNQKEYIETMESNDGNYWMNLWVFGICG